jgi:hypothetical protein
MIGEPNINRSIFQQYFSAKEHVFSYNKSAAAAAKFQRNKQSNILFFYLSSNSVLV